MSTYTAILTRSCLSSLPISHCLAQFQVYKEVQFIILCVAYARELPAYLGIHVMGSRAGIKLKNS